MICWPFSHHCNLLVIHLHPPHHPEPLCSSITNRKRQIMAKRSRHKASTISDEDPEFTLGTPHRSKRMRKVEVSPMTEDDYCQPESREDTTSDEPSDPSSDRRSTLGCVSQRYGVASFDESIPSLKNNVLT